LHDQLEAGSNNATTALRFGKDTLLRLLEVAHPEVAEKFQEKEFPLTKPLFDRLSYGDLQIIEAAIAEKLGQEQIDEVKRWQEQSFQHYRREILRLSVKVVPELIEPITLLTPHNPPPHIHSMVRKDIFVGDLYSGDMTIEALQRAGHTFVSGKAYLEFGCSSAPLLRTMYALRPDVCWHGCDPIEASISWAAAHFPHLILKCNPQWPRLEYDDATFSGAYAISVWSHFSEPAALVWFGELHRIIQPGGFLMFTAHGWRSLYYYLNGGGRDPVRVASLVNELATNQFAFFPIFALLGRTDNGLDCANWGEAYLTPDWVIRSLSGEWDFEDFQVGRNQSNQDVYVLRRR
jgi:hypothetical protein